jgi:hypothetical protein
MWMKRDLAKHRPIYQRNFRLPMPSVREVGGDIEGRQPKGTICQLHNVPTP